MERDLSSLKVLRIFSKSNLSNNFSEILVNILWTFETLVLCGPRLRYCSLERLELRCRGLVVALSPSHSALFLLVSSAVSELTPPLLSLPVTRRDSRGARSAQLPPSNPPRRRSQSPSRQRQPSGPPHSSRSVHADRLHGAVNTAAVASSLSLGLPRARAL